MTLTRKPRVGDLVFWPDTPKVIHTVTRIEGNLAWILHPDNYPMRQYRGQTLPFIWNFPGDGTSKPHLNILATFVDDGQDKRGGRDCDHEGLVKETLDGKRTCAACHEPLPPPDPRERALMADALEAEEHFTADELEAHADAMRKGER